MESLSHSPQQHDGVAVRSVEDHHLLTTGDVSRLLRVSAHTLRKWRMSGNGPRFFKAGSTVRYRASAVEAWIADREFDSTASEAVAQLGA